MLGLIRRNFSSTTVHVKSQLYKTLVRPKLEYSCSIWDPGQANLTNLLESLQNRAARFILSNYARHASISSMKLTLGLPDLAVCRKFMRLCLFHKIYYTNPVLKDELFLPPSYISPRNDHQMKVGIPRCKSNYYFYSFIPRTAADWNHLPASIAAISDTINFKKIANDFICTHHSSL